MNDEIQEIKLTSKMVIETNHHSRGSNVILSRCAAKFKLQYPYRSDAIVYYIPVNHLLWLEINVVPARIITLLRWKLLTVVILKL